MNLIWDLVTLAWALAVITTNAATAEEPCRFPAAWIGQWYWKESVFNITEDVLGSKGRCVQRQDIKYLIQSERAGRKCYICVVIFLRHSNIIEFKESRLCGERPLLRQICRTIGGDEPLHTMIRAQPRPVPCPFRGPFTFDYRRSDKVCSAPVSRAWSCAAPWRLTLQHQACPDVAGAERLSEQLTCLATWRNHDTHFMFGRLDSVKTKTDADRYRCFIYQRFDNGHNDRGFHVVQSGDSTCQGLQSVFDGHKVMNLYDDKHSTRKCKLPEWFTVHHKWHTMDAAQRYHIFHRNHSIKVTDLIRSAQAAGTNESTKLMCNRLVKNTENVWKVVFHRSRDCFSGYQCAVLYRRGGNVVEMKMGDVTHSPDTACQYFAESRYNFTTLIASSLAGHPCPYLGRHAVIGVRREGRVVRDTCSGAFTTLVMGCRSSDTLQLRSECRQGTRSAEYRCHGNWEENGTHFLVTSAVGESAVSAKRVCFVSMETDEGLHFSTLQEACYRNMTLGQDGFLAFNVTIDGDCRAEASTTRSTSAQLTAGGVSWLLCCCLLWLCR